MENISESILKQTIVMADILFNRRINKYYIEHFNKTSIRRRNFRERKKFNKADVHDYGQLLFERFTHRYKVDHQEIDLKTDDDNYHGSCYVTNEHAEMPVKIEHEIIVKTFNLFSNKIIFICRILQFCLNLIFSWRNIVQVFFSSKKSDLNASLTCCQKDWSGIDNINIKQCVRCHKTFTRFDIYQTLNHTKHYCNICWIYQKEFVIKNEKQSSFIRCNLCGQLLLDQLTDDIIAMNFVHPKCLEKHLDE
ncbi:unnamed protein product [Rotaria socialis]